MRAVKLNKNADFKRIYKRGTPLIGKYIIVYAMPNRHNCNRIGITVSKKLGCAVVRNRVRRIISESYRLSASGHKTGYDFIIVGRSRCITAKMPEILECMNDLLFKNGFFKT